MKVKKTRWFALALALGLASVALVLTVPRSGLAQLQAAERSLPDQSLLSLSSPSSLGLPSMVSAPSGAVGPMTVDGSSVQTADCYRAGITQTLCFAVTNGSTDGEWLDGVQLTFPTLAGNWRVACNTALQDLTDSVGYAVDFNCTTPLVNRVVFQDGDSDGYGEISMGSSWGACVDVHVPAPYAGDRYIPWVLSGDGGGTTSGSIKMEKCTPLTLRPSQVVIEGCNGIPQVLEFELWNYGAGNVDVDLTYAASAAEFVGPPGFHIEEGEVLTFTTHFAPGLCVESGETISGSLTAEAQVGGHSDTSAITQTVTEFGGWHRREDSSIPAMDNAVVWANRGDGGLWSVGGYGSEGAAQRFDPGSGGWLTYTNPLTPVIEYPMDGCYGLNEFGDEIVVLFPDTIVTATLQIFNITAKQWYTEAVPVAYPIEGRWGQDIVSMIQHTDRNECYLSGGSTQVGGGRTRNLWRYDPGDNTAVLVGDFVGNVWFGFHASWFVPWIGPEGAICVAGGVDHNHQINNTSQCYDIASDAFHGLNADLGTLPEPWWGMADGWQITDEGYELWIANGVAQDGTLLPASAYLKEGEKNFQYGPAVPHGLYRLEGGAWNDQFYTLNGSRGGFWSSEFSLQLVSCPFRACHAIFLPLMLGSQ